MKIIIRFVFFVLVFSAACFADDDESGGKFLIYRGASDASAAAAVGKNMFIVADDENNILRIYKTSEAGQPAGSYDMTEFLDIDPEHAEADIEGATMVGQRIYWITSHGRNKDGKIRPNRYRFFATEIKVDNENVAIRPVGKPCKTLVHSLVKTQAGRRLGLDKATRFDEAGLKKKDRERLAPKKEGLNIEGLCASADGKTVYIGFRNPRPMNGLSGRAEALIMPLYNPDGVIERAEAPIFGEPILWNLKGLGVRSMEYSHFHRAYFIIAGCPDEEDTFALYRWSGKGQSKPVFVQELNLDTSKFCPEALIPFEDSSRLLLLSDDGSIPIKVVGPHECLEDEYRKDGTCLNKYLADSRRKTFRALWLALSGK